MTSLTDSRNTTISFSKLLTDDSFNSLLMALDSLLIKPNHRLAKDKTSLEDDILKSVDFNELKSLADEYKATAALIRLFNTLFDDQRVQLVRAKGEPEYFPASNGNLARIEFAHGFFASALHEISHWCIAGNARRQLSDFGYWYAADGRSEAQQRAFERVEIKPQALECLFTLACQRPFQVSQDNLFADFDTSKSTFANDVYRQVIAYLSKPQSLPIDAQKLLQALLTIAKAW